ncbi:MAG: hypothetical protein ACLQJR_20445 [Stellaceae bacterium]
MAVSIRKDLEGKLVWLTRVGPQPDWGSRKVARRFRDLWEAADALKALPPAERHRAAVVPAD